MESTINIYQMFYKIDLNNSILTQLDACDKEKYINLVTLESDENLWRFTKIALICPPAIICVIDLIWLSLIRLYLLLINPHSALTIVKPTKRFMLAEYVFSNCIPMAVNKT